MKLLDAKNISYAIANKTILKNINIELHSGEILGLIGPNGAGKSTLLKVLASLTDHYEGSYQLKEKNISEYSRKALAKIMGYQEQSAPVHWPLPVQRVVELGRLPHQGFNESLNDTDIQLVNAAIDKAEITDLLERDVSSLSGGERMRVLLARLFAGEHEIILADEPVASLDPYHQVHVMELLAEHAKAGNAIIVVLHDITLAARFCDKVILLDQGQCVAQDSVLALHESKELEKAYQMTFHKTELADGVILTPWRRL